MGEQFDMPGAQIFLVRKRKDAVGLCPDPSWRPTSLFSAPARLFLIQQTLSSPGNSTYRGVSSRVGTQRPLPAAGLHGCCLPPDYTRVWERGGSYKAWDCEGGSMGELHGPPNRLCVSPYWESQRAPLRESAWGSPEAFLCLGWGHPVHT